MKIRKIKLENDNLFGNLNLDFTNIYEKTLDTIILAGDNGVGKTSIIRLINNVYSGQFNTENNRDNNSYNFSIEFECPESEIKRFPFPEGVLMNNFHLDENSNYIGIFNKREVLLLKKNGNYQKIAPIDHQNIYFPYQSFDSKIIISNADLNYKVQPITSITAIKDFNQFEVDSIGTSLAQHLINLKTQDALDLADWVTNHPGEIPTSSIIDTRIKKFSDAFHNMFPNKRFIGIKDIGSIKEIQFKEFNRIMNIGQLSSGEKQIVFRASHILSSIDSSTNNCILIDEPELSLHPDWQKKIINFFKIILADTNYQMFIATHSPFIIHNETRCNDKIIILKKDTEGQIYTPVDKSFYHNWTNEEVVKEAFGINISNIPNNCIFVEGKTDEKYIKSCIETYDLNITQEVHWIGTELEKGREIFTGETSLDRTIDFIQSNQHFFKQSITVLYDCDCKRLENDITPILKVRRLNNNPENSIFKKGIESLLHNLALIIPDYNKKFYTVKTKTDDYGGSSVIQTLNKNELCNFICDEMEKEDRKIIFKYLKEEIIRIAK